MKNILINPTATIKDALKRLDETAEKVLLVVNEHDILLGALTDGDIRRYILKTGNIEGSIQNVFNKNPIVSYKNQNIEEIKQLLFKNKIDLIPLLDENNKVIGYYRWVDFYNEELENYKISDKIDIPVVIMAGGKGTRLDPFTKVLPKPLLPIKDKTVTEHIIERFKKYGVNKFYLTLNYKGKVIESYFNSIEKDYDIDFIWEDEFLGTAGSLFLLKDKIKSDFFLANCDNILRTNFFNIYNFHSSCNAQLTSITSIQHYQIPYGVVHIKEQGLIDRIEEKPEYTFQVNTGVYLINNKVFNYITEKKKLDMPELIKILINDNNKVLAYPINEKDYLDVGQWEEYKDVLNILK
jgi:dTDP-glucose pyrophosphorylase